MKKNIFFLGMAALALAACSGNPYDEWADPQHSDAEDAKTVAINVGPAAAIDFATLTADSVQLFVPTVSAETGAVNTYNVVLNNEDKTATSDALTANDKGYVATSDLRTAYYALVGRKPVQRTIDINVTSFTKINGESIKGEGTTTAALTADAPVISSAYYVVGGTLDWGQSAANRSQKFSHSDKDVYDDPVFTITIPASENGDTWFAIGSEETCQAIADNADGAWKQLIATPNGNGKNGVDDTEPFTFRTEIDNDGSFCVPASYGAKYIHITLNMLDQTITINPLNFSEYIYEVGNNNDWGNSGTAYALWGQDFDGKYYGAFNLKSGFKFRSNHDDWNGSFNLGYDANGNYYNNGGSSDIKLEDGFYMITVDAANQTYTFTPFQTIGLIGGATPGGWNTDTPMTYNSADHTWVINSVTLTDGGVKFRSDNNWNAVNFGGSLDQLRYNGGDINVSAGTYKIVLHLENNGARAPYAEFTKLK